MANGEITGAMMNGAAEIERLTRELERAYRCIVGFSTAHRKGELLDSTAFAYHSPTIGAARRFVIEDTDEIDGADYFDGKHVSVLHDALKL
jgi:hypothetical protein